MPGGDTQRALRRHLPGNAGRRGPPAGASGETGRSCWRWWPIRAGPGGKRIRPALLLLGGPGVRRRAAAAGGITLASVAEMMHAATLLHDDIVDHAATRRGRPSAMAPLGSGRVGPGGGLPLFPGHPDPDGRRGRADPARPLRTPPSAMTEAEILQLATPPRPRHQRGGLLQDRHRKDGGPDVGGLSRRGLGGGRARRGWSEALAAFGLDLGIGFQLVDDALDYVAREERLGKPVGSDFREGKMTYPVIHVDAARRRRGPAARWRGWPPRERLADEGPGCAARAGGAVRGRAGHHAPGGRVPRPRPRANCTCVPGIAGPPRARPAGGFRPRARLVIPLGSRFNVQR